MKDTSRYIGPVYRNIYKNKASSRAQIAAELGISLPTVTQNLNYLIEKGLVYEAGEFESTGGRKANIYSIVAEARLTIGVDITQTSFSIVLVDLNLVILDRISHHVMFEDSMEYRRRIGDAVRGMILKNEIREENLLGIGISLPAIIKEDQKTITFARVISVGRDFYGEMKKHMPARFLFFNDASSAGWAEIWNRDEEKPMVYLSLSNSVGGAFLMNKQIYNGRNWRSSEFGHICIVPKGKKCYCGLEGCVDAYCSAQVLTDFTDGDLEGFFTKVLEEKNAGYSKILDEYLQHLSSAVANLRMCYDCDVILGGNVGGSLETFLETCRGYVIQKTMFEKRADFLQICSMKKEPSAVGAALYYVNEFIQGI